MTTSVSVRPTQLNLLLYAGDGFTQQFNFVDEADVPVDVTGDWTAQVRAATSSTTTLAEFTIDDSGAATGEIIVSLTGEEVRDIGTEAVWDLQQQATGAEPRTWVRGRISVAEDVTRA